MIREPFNDGWRVGGRTSIFEQFMPGAGAEPVAVTLPHDAMLAGGRSAEGSDGSHTGYHRPGAWRYDKDFEAPAWWAAKRVSIEFEGVYRDAMVYINDVFAGQWANGYSTFHIAADPYLRYGRTNTIRVEAQAYKDSRWYSGGGIHRPVHLLIGDLLHITPTGLRVSTPQIDDELAVAAVATEVVNEGTGTRTVEVLLEVCDGDGEVVATDRVPLTVLAGERATVRQRAYLRRPALWSVEEPNLYTATVRLSDAGGQVDEARTTFGVRSVSVDPIRGLRINGVPVKLRGACVHHDNGPLGSAAIARAEERRVRLLKEAGFNAIRSAHNPLSTAMLEACDRLGMLVMDETFDMWTVSKTDDDYARRFPQWWERDVDALVAKDFNHPSVIFYSIGNEILEVGNPHGARWGRLLAERIRAQDPTRLVTNALNGMMAIMDQIPALMAQAARADGAPAEANDAPAQGSGAPGFNDLLEGMGALAALPEVGERIAESAAVLDVVGLNYGDSRYLTDHQTHPNRVMVGSETFPTQIDHYWKLVTEHGHIIGDFTWTGWDYLGESGIGRPTYPGEGPAFAAPYPWLTASTGDLDITGRRRPVSYYRETVYGLRRTPYLAVQRPEHREFPFQPKGWAWSDSIAGWTWDIPAGTPVIVEAYADADEIEFVLNGATMAKVPVGAGKAYLATAEVPYRPGTLEAVAYRDGAETGRCLLRTADAPARLLLSPDRPHLGTDPQDLAYLDIRVVDEHETINPISDRTVTVDLDGPAILQALGTARPSTEESFQATSCTTYEGHALAVLRPTGAEGLLTVTVRADDLPPATVTIEVRRP
ncbi:glycoside hydrolase family 2 TIM barrel-domain containing protein [Nonomuraea sp. LP-02]|uniref:glycoside hydrolase family 2 TIM barrel-domain containing protein n=1 Tax=Nonomuraea sp. LP-02 TaxID=3097960 RepID=UPI002E335721|nr:glycoside hydrolase family 2 TIM barrel-domain containing protein [Nonomuraea sp. LP-02]MED7931388.1 glycoside hydrolase family 2 TIM barrel-domain containing protein [Nonomuraea sp. LP-02]